MLSAFYTGCRFPHLHRLMRTTGNRALSAALRPHSRQVWLPEIAGKLLQKCGFGGQAMIRRRNEWFQRLIPDAAIKSADVVIGFDTSGWLLARRCKKQGKPFILDRTTIHRTTRNQIRASHRLAFASGPDRADPEQDEIENEEMQSAAAIVVASSFARESLMAAGIPESKIEVIPYGVNLKQFAPAGSYLRLLKR